MSEQKPAPGWYPAPHANNEQRYWDGTRWTEPTTAAPVYPGTTTALATKPARGLGIAALVVGIVAFLVGWVPVFGAIVGVAAIALGVIALLKKQSKGLAITGLALGAIALITSIAVTVGVANFAANSPRPSVVESSESTPSESLAAEPTEEVTEPPAEEQPVAPAAPDQASFVSVDDRGWALIAKDPDSNSGTNVILFGTITQFDSATGNCAMLISTAGTQKEMSYEYDQNVMAVSGDWDTVCPTFDQFVEGDHVQIWATVDQSFSYDTQIGGNTTVPMIEVWYAQLLPATEY